MPSARKWGEGGGSYIISPWATACAQITAELILEGAGPVINAFLP